VLNTAINRKKWKKRGEKMVDVTYSVDMVRMKTKVPKEYWSRFVKSKLDLEPGAIYWRKTDFKSYGHNWQIRQSHEMGGEYSYWLGYAHNSEDSTSQEASLVIEYNPNKCPIDGLLEYILGEFYASKDTEIVTLDIAMDFEVNITNLIVDKFRKNKMKIIYGGQGEDDLTYYLGQGDGRIKIYNKARELGVDGDLTRYEVTKKINKKIRDVLMPEFEFEAEIPTVGYLNTLPTDKTLEGLLWAVRNGYSMQRLTRYSRDKMREFISDNTELQFDDKKISQAIRIYFQGYKDILQFR